MTRLAIIGAGLAGLAAGWALRDAGLEITIFEKRGELSGRAATRHARGVIYDPGAQYFKTPTPAAAEVVLHRLSTDGLVDIGRPVWIFDSGGRIQPGDPVENAAPKWVYRDGISRLGKRLAEGARAVIQTGIGVARIEQTLWGWQLVGDQGNDLGLFEAVLLTPPAPQAAELVEASRMDAGLRETLSDGLRRATYRSLLSVTFAFSRPVPRPGDFYALVNTDREHPISWLAFEEDKPGHVPAGQTVLIVQMAPEWSVAHFSLPLDDLWPAVAALAGELLGCDLDAPAWSDLERWRYALPNTLADREALAQGEPAGLFFAGDALAGGRVHLALESGLAAAAAIRASLGAGREPGGVPGASSSAPE